MGRDCEAISATKNGRKHVETNGNSAVRRKLKATANYSNGVKNGLEHLTADGNESKLSQFWAFACLTIFPFALLAVHVSCSRFSCSIWEIPSFPTDISSYINTDAISVYFAWLTIQFLLFILPFGPKIQYKTAEGEVLTYRMNGSAACFITYFFVFVSIYSGFSYEIVTSNFLSLHVLSILTSAFLALGFHIKSSLKKNKKGERNSFFMRFANGSEAHPKIWNLDMKRYLIRTSLLTWGVIGFVVQASECYSPRGLHPSNTLVTLIHIYLAAETVLSEESWISSVLFRHDKVGFQFIYSCLTAVPILFTMTMRYTVDQHTPMSELAVISRFFLCVPGYYLYRMSLSDKSLFADHPNDEDFNKSFVIRNNKGGAILADGLWSHSRNPNYLGCFLLGLNWLSPGFDGIYKSACVIVLAVYLINRSFTVDEINRRLHGKMWDTYCQKVKARILKHVF